MTWFVIENLASGCLTHVSVTFNTEINWQQGGFANRRWGGGTMVCWILSFHI